ncbi:FAR1-related sequence 5-like protein, partial [Tanacetum coccineum]
EKPNENRVNLICDENQINDDNIIGRFVDTPDDAYTFYNQYGFGIRIHWKYKNKTKNKVYRKLYVCNKQGFKKQKGDNSSEVSKKHRRDVRTGYEAKLRISKTKDGKWRVDIFNDTHNHDLTTTPTKVMKHRFHNKFHRSMTCKSLMVELGKSGLRPCQVRKASVNCKERSKEPSINLERNGAEIYCTEEQKQYKGKEFYSLIKHFQEKAAVDVNQYFKIDLFDDGSPRNIFWADGRLKDAYLKFGDVVVFHVTYLTNKFKFSFAPIVGVNHHGQSIIFGGALLENGKEETFKCNWMMEMYKQRKFWVSAFFKDIFLAGMTTSGRSKSIHSFFDGFVNSKNMLNEFVIQFDKVVDTRRAVEKDEDFKTMNSRPVLSSVHPIEAKAGECYTKKIFELFQKEWIEATSNLTHETKKDQMIRKKPTEIENAYKDARVGISQVDMMPQNRDPVVLTIVKGRPRNATRVKPPLEVKLKKTVTCSYCRKPGHNITGCKEKKVASMQDKKMMLLLLWKFS